MNPLRSFARNLFTQSRQDRKRHRTRLALESLEAREVPAVAIYRSIDGSGNNLTHTNWGQAGTDFIRIAPAQYGDGISTPAGASRPSARAVSNAVSAQQGQDTTDDRMMSAMVYAWGQFIDHDLDSTQTGTEAFNIAVPKGDSSFDPSGTGTQVIPLSRSGYDSKTGSSTSNPRQQINGITAWLDGSMIYGSDSTTAQSLRTFSGGKLKTSTDNLLPTDSTGSFLAGDTRVTENPELTSLQTLFLREHNRVADQLAKANPALTDQQLYQQARAFVIGEVQAITYNEWLPTLLGPGAISPYTGYKPNVNPTISNEFAAAGFRFGHSIVGGDIEFIGNDGRSVADEVSLAEAFFNPSIVKSNGIDSILKYLSSDPSQALDTKVVDQLRNFLFGQPGQGGLDLASLNIQRGRDHGLADYNSTRAALGLPRVTDFSQITSDTALQAKLKSLYGSVNNIDLWVGVLAEKHVPGSSVGQTLRAIIVDQFSRLRDGDRFWYENNFTGTQLQQLRTTSLSDLIHRNTTNNTIQHNTFIFQVEISGMVFGDPNRDGKRNPGEIGLAGRTIQLIDADSGEVVGTTITDATGQYRFNTANGLGTGRYSVKQVLPTGAVETTPTNRIFAIASGDTLIRGIDLGSAIGNLPPRQPPAQPPQPGPRPV